MNSIPIDQKTPAGTLRRIHSFVEEEAQLTTGTHAICGFTLTANDSVGSLYPADGKALHSTCEECAKRDASLE
jgi:hypothetical protein